MTAPAIPQRDADYDAYLNNWRTLMTATPALYGMLAADATAISLAYTNWHPAYVVVTNPATRTHAAVVAKDIQKASSQVLLRDQYNIIKANPAVLDVNKTSIGVRVSDTVPTPIPPPATFPLLNVFNSAAFQQSMEMHDSATPTIRKKPAGVIGALVYRGIGTVPAIDPEQLPLMGFFTRALFDAETFDALDAGKIATYAAKWTNAKGEEGPWSAMVSKVIPN